MTQSRYTKSPEDAIDTLARTLYGEARGEKVRGLEAVAAVIINRVEKAIQRGGYWWGADVENVCLRPWQFSCWNVNDPNREKILTIDGKNKIFATCCRIARRAVFGALKDPTKGATHYHRTGLLPAWARNQIPCAEVGHHVFYKDIP
ncbi:cell wall hydrolase [Terasakiella sp. A23]|uniref:cell wall hydrolase n=1 Tax=Terasakiella sp. FCG-A23 TaxID=3080561 RepID=UPI0029531DAB|nr:cell wall hydrolase [Terasakiella sp. A23]MDV7341732.1 cell wall hydrolase [Terasakiella sp. A23]